MDKMECIKKYLVSCEIPEEESEALSYGFLKIILFAVNLCVFEIIGIIFKCPIEMAIFLIAYIPLRIFVGGFHLSKLKYCEILSIVEICIIALVIHVFSKSSTSGIITYLSAVLVLIHYVLSPQDNSNKMLYKHEKQRYKRIVIIMITMYYAVSVIMYHRGYFRFQLIIILAMIMSGVSLIENQIYNKIKEADEDGV